MATVKIKFKPAAIDGGEGTIYYQVIHDQHTKRISTPYKLHPTEWVQELEQIVCSPAERSRLQYLLMTEKKMAEDTTRLKSIIMALELRGRPFTAQEVASAFLENHSGIYFQAFMQEVIHRLQLMGKVRLVETYGSALRSFMRFTAGKDVLLHEVDGELMAGYERWLKSNGIALNTVSFYMRILRATYNRAVERKLTVQRFPFKHVYTGVEKTAKRAVSLEVMKRIKELDLSMDASKRLARDMLLFSFYTRGMAMVDMAFLKKADLAHGFLSYRRKKTGQQLVIRWESCMQELVERYSLPQSPYLLPLIRKPGTDERKQYTNASHRINKHLKAIGQELGLPVPLTLYVARHSWASAAHSRHIPLSVISKGMGHDSEHTTCIYLASLDNTPIDQANKMILNILLKR